jgi:hypothetical protein
VTAGDGGQMANGAAAPAPTDAATIAAGATIDAARRAAHASNVAAVLTLLGVLATAGAGIAEQRASTDNSTKTQLEICTAVAIHEYGAVYRQGLISNDQYQRLIEDAIKDQEKGKSSGCK